MKFKNLLINSKEPFLKAVKIIASLFVLSLILEVCTIFLTVVPYDYELVKILFDDTKVMVLNFLPLFFIMAICYFITNSMGWGFGIVSILTFVVAQVNINKMVYRDAPFVFSDIFLVTEAKEMMKNYSLEFTTASVWVLVSIIIVAICACLFLKRIKIKKIYIRIPAAVVSCVVLVLLYNNLYINNYDLHTSMWHEEFGNVYKTANQSMSRGLVYSFGRSIAEAFPAPPEGYDEDKTEEILDKYSDSEMDDEKKVNMICIMLEAYNDFAKFPGMEFVMSPYTNMHQLQKDSYSGSLYTDIFAGGTIATERSFLTGYVNHDIKKDTMSHVWYLRNQGYYTKAMHPFYGWFYNRRNVNEYLGFEDFDYVENKYGSIPDEKLKESKYYDMLSDMDFFDCIIEGYEEAMERNQPYFNFCVTYQNHGPYATERYVAEEFAKEKEEYPEPVYNNFNAYLCGIYRTDRALAKLREFIDNRDEPVVLVLFGDHNPLLGSDNSGYHTFGIDIDLSTPQGAENYYTTPYLFYANEAAKKQLGKSFVGEGPTISPIFLMDELFEYMGTEGSAYMNYLRDVKKDLPVINPVYIKENAKYIARDPQNEHEKVLEREWMEYYLQDTGY